MHQDFVFDATGGVGGKPRLFVGVVRVDGFDQTDGADGDQIVRLFPRVVELFDDVSDEPQVSLDQDVAGLLAPFGPSPLGVSPPARERAGSEKRCGW